jgi:hypothetical protein
MAEFVNQDDEEQSQIFQDVPKYGRVAARPALDLVHRDEKPGPMQENINSSKTKQANRALTVGRHDGKSNSLRNAWANWNASAT